MSWVLVECDSYIGVFSVCYLLGSYESVQRRPSCYLTVIRYVMLSNTFSIEIVLDKIISCAERSLTEMVSIMPHIVFPLLFRKISNI